MKTLTLWLVLALALPGLALAQGVSVRAGTGTGAVLRTLDKLSGNVIDVEMVSGQTMGYGPLEVTLMECRYPAANPSGDAFAHLVIETSTGASVFDGWMVASAPALSALDHPRYDIWVLRCIRS